MCDYLDRIAAATTWRDYYDAHKAAFTAVLCDHWAFGRPSFAQQLHHTAIPDVSGTVAGTMNWAVYSQPSAETLESFLNVFVELLRSEPQRIRSSRYLFFVTKGPVLSREIISRILAPYANRIDYWCGSFDEVFLADQPRLFALGVEALFGTRRWLIGIESKNGNTLDSVAATYLKTLHTVAHVEADYSYSVAPDIIRSALVDSSIILLGFRTGWSPDYLGDLLGKRGGIAAYIAMERVRNSFWTDEALAFCQEILKRCPPNIEEYIVQPGDMLSRIIRERYEMSYDRLWPLIQTLNPDLRDPNLIRTGKGLKLPVL